MIEAMKALGTVSALRNIVERTVEPTFVNQSGVVSE